MKGQRLTLGRPAARKVNFLEVKHKLCVFCCFEVRISWRQETCRDWVIFVRVLCTGVDNVPTLLVGPDSLQGERRGEEGQQSQEVSARKVEGNGRGRL